MSKLQFMALWAVGGIAYLFAFGFLAMFGITGIYEDHDDLEGLRLLIGGVFSVLMVPGKWILLDPRPGSVDLYEMLLFALCVAVNIACWGMLLPLTWFGLRRVTRTPSTVTR